MTCMWESSLLWSVMEWGMLDCVAPLIGTKLQCLVLIKSIVIVTSWSSRNIWWSKTDRALTHIQSAGMLRGVRHKFRELFCTNDCFIFPENSLSYFCKTKPRQWKPFLCVASPCFTKHKAPANGFESRILTVSLSPLFTFYLNTTAENIRILLFCESILEATKKNLISYLSYFRHI